MLFFFVHPIGIGVCMGLQNCLVAYDNDDDVHPRGFLKYNVLVWVCANCGDAPSAGFDSLPCLATVHP